jgi:DNA-binding CsgD family transcriptional regulator
LLGRDGTLRSSTPAGARWLEELNDLDRPRTDHLPTVIGAVVERLKACDENAPGEASARTLAPSGRWLTVHASLLNDPADSVAVVVEPTSPLTLAPLIVAGFALTARETEVTRRLLIGLARKSIATELGISLHTVNDHIKSIFDKTGASSAGELRTHIFRQSHAATTARERTTDAEVVSLTPALGTSSSASASLDTHRRTRV